MEPVFASLPPCSLKISPIDSFVKYVAILYVLTKKDYENQILAAANIVHFSL
jgi:hypothetical protein